MATPFPSQAIVEIPFPEKGDWTKEGNSLDLGPFHSSYCRGNLYKTADNKLYVYIEIDGGWPEVTPAYLPLNVPETGLSYLRIRWAEEGVSLRQDSFPAISTPWKKRP